MVFFRYFISLPVVQINELTLHVHQTKAHTYCLEKLTFDVHINDAVRFLRLKIVMNMPNYILVSEQICVWQSEYEEYNMFYTCATKQSLCFNINLFTRITRDRLKRNYIMYDMILCNNFVELQI